MHTSILPSFRLVKLLHLFQNPIYGRQQNHRLAQNLPEDPEIAPQVQPRTQGTRTGGVNNTPAPVPLPVLNRQQYQGPQIHRQQHNTAQGVNQNRTRRGNQRTSLDNRPMWRY